jgi:hypothetical protein
MSFRFMAIPSIHAAVLYVLSTYHYTHLLFLLDPTQSRIHTVKGLIGYLEEKALMGIHPTGF